MTYLSTTSVRKGDTSLVQNKYKFLKVSTSSGYKTAVEQLLGSPELRSQMTDLKAVNEVYFHLFSFFVFTCFHLLKVRALERFYSTLANSPDRATYGFNDIKHADDSLAVDELLVTDHLFKAANVGVRKQYVDLVESVREHGGKVFVFSSMHVSGAQLDQYTGIAATLRFPLIVPSNDCSQDNNQETKSNLNTNNNNNQTKRNNKTNNNNKRDEDEDYRPIPVYPFQQLHNNNNNLNLNLNNNNSKSKNSCSSNQESPHIGEDKENENEENEENGLDERDRNDLCDDFIGEERRRRLSSADLSSFETLHFDMDMMGLDSS